jgi:hypothetical protein
MHSHRLNTCYIPLTVLPALKALFYLILTATFVALGTNIVLNFTDEENLSKIK